MATAKSNLKTSIYRFLSREGSKGLTVFSIRDHMSHDGRNQRQLAKNVERTINKNPDYFYKEEHKIYPKTDLRLCGHPETHDNECPLLHICKFFLMSNDCIFNHKCIYGHVFESEQNLKILKKHDLHGLNFELVRSVLLLHCNRSTETTPSVCIYYNMEGGCRKHLQCNSLHICKKYIDSKSHRNCNKNHDVNDEQVKMVLLKYGFGNTGLNEKLVALVKSTSENTSTHPTVVSYLKHKYDTPEICYFFLNGGCSRRKCKFIHSKMYYAWFYYNDQWFKFPDGINEKLENSYTDPNIKDILLSGEVNNIFKVDFEKMVAINNGNNSFSIRRIESSHASWTWYWKDESNSWMKLSPQIKEQNDVIEKHFKNSEDLILHFTFPNTYTQLSFEKMELTYNSTPHSVCRRPNKR